MNVRDQVRVVVERMGDPLMSDITEAIDRPVEEVKAVVREMVKRSELRMKEDSIDHDWSYRKGRNW